MPDRDPIPRYRDQLLQSGGLSAEQYRAMQDSAALKVEDAIQFAKASPAPAPTPSEHLKYLFSEGVNS